MKKYYNGWRRFLCEQKESQYKIYCDMDGVLINFADSVLERMNNLLSDVASIQNPKLKKAAEKVKQKEGNREIVIADLRDTKNKIVEDLMYRSIEGDEDFWANLPWQSDGKELWNFTKDRDVYILSAPSDSGREECIEGKKEWIQKNLDISPDRCFFEKDKFKFAQSPTSILIDDYIKNTVLWKEHGGIAILHKDTQSTISQLEKILS